MEGGGWSYGADLEFMRALCAHWREGFDWRAMAARLNAIGPQYTLRVDSGLCPIELHYVHARSPHAGAKQGETDTRGFRGLT